MTHPRRAPGSLARMVADFRAALLDEAGHRGEGARPLAPMFARIDRVGDKRGLARLLGSTMRADVDPLDVGTYSLGVGARTLGGAQHPRRDDLHRVPACKAVSRSGTATST